MQPKRIALVLAAVVILIVFAMVYSKNYAPITSPKSTDDASTSSEVATSAPVGPGKAAKDTQPTTNPVAGPEAGKLDPRPAPPKGVELPKAAATGNSKPTPMDYGHFAPVKGDANPQAASVMEALKTKSHPERLSVLIAPEPFNKAKYDADPDLYARTVTPGRVFQTAAPAADVPELKPLTNTMAVASQNDAVKMSVKATPGSPATFVSQDGGYFQENKLNTITVRADKDGVAAVTYTAGPGTIGDVNVLAGSPLSSGQVRFKVMVQGAGVAAAPAVPSQNK